MTDYFVGPGGNNANAGTSWSLRKLTLAGAEALSLVGGDRVWVGAGVYRESLSVGNSGGSAYSTGTVSVTQGSATVTGSSTVWTTNAAAGGQFRTGGYGPYEIQSVDSNTQITLVQPFGGATASGASYAVYKDIKYIGDVTGFMTDGIGGLVRITGTGNDAGAATRNTWLTCSSQGYRTFRGFVFDALLSTSNGIQLTSANDIIIEDSAMSYQAGGGPMFNCSGASQLNVTMRRCYALVGTATSIQFTHTASVNNSGHLFENNVVIGPISGRAINVIRVGGIMVRNSFIACASAGIATQTASPPQALTAYNNVIYGCGSSGALLAFASGDITSDYNNLYANLTNYSSVTAGTHDTTYSPLFAFPMLLNMFGLPNIPLFSLSEYSALRALGSTSPAGEDVFGISRPVTNSKLSIGPFQWSDVSQSTTQVDAGTYSRKLADAGREQYFIPVTNVSTTFSIKVYRESSYAGTAPQVILKQPGQADITLTDAGSSAAWNTLSTTFTPATLPGWVCVELVSNNTATSGSFAVYWDTESVS